MSTPRRIGMLIFPRLTQLDMTGPYEVLARGCRIRPSTCAAGTLATV